MQRRVKSQDQMIREGRLVLAVVAIVVVAGTYWVTSLFWGDEDENVAPLGDYQRMVAADVSPSLFLIPSDKSDPDPLPALLDGARWLLTHDDRCLEVMHGGPD